MGEESLGAIFSCSKCNKHAAKDTRRWGYCTRSGMLVFNWQLISLPPKRAEYVVLHEYVHLSRFNHRRGFYNILSNMCPDYKKRVEELKTFLPEHISLT